MNKNISILGGGTIKKIRPHFALSSASYGSTAIRLFELCYAHNDFKSYRINLYLTKMAKDYNYASSERPETIEDVESLLKRINQDERSKIVFMNCAMVDFDCDIKCVSDSEGRLDSERNYIAHLTANKKYISEIKRDRKDIFLVGFKTTYNAKDLDEMFLKGLKLLKTSGCNLVLVNDIKHRFNMIVTPEESYYFYGENRELALSELVDISAKRSNLTFNRTTLISEFKREIHDIDEYHENFTKVVKYCVKAGYYKPNILGVTTGHFCIRDKFDKNILYSSIRKSDYTKELKLTKLQYSLDHVYSGVKPSAGAVTQKLLLDKNPEYDCIIHFHCREKDGVKFSSRKQRNFECGSLECGLNTLDGLQEIKLNSKTKIKIVMLEKHGPNILFRSKDNPEDIISFITKHFETNKGYM